MKTKALFIVLLSGLGYATASAAAPDSRFDGIWVGTETMMGQEMHGALRSKTYARNTPAKIAIAQSGTLVGVVEGYGQGRYNEVRRVGDTLIFQAGSRKGQLSLSTDGSTLIEKGIVPRTSILNYGVREGATSGRTRTIQLSGVSEITGTFHRAK